MQLAALCALLCSTFAVAHVRDVFAPTTLAGTVINGIPYETREYWMKVANDAVAALGPTPCSTAPFGTVIVHHGTDGVDEEICQGINTVQYTGNPQLHGEVSAFRNCTARLRLQGLSADEISRRWTTYSLYTNGEPCPQCMSAIRYAGIKEVVWGSSIASIYATGRPQLLVSSYEINEKSLSMGTNTRIIPGVLAEVTDQYYTYQFNESAPCPDGCERLLSPGQRVTRCEVTAEWSHLHGKV